MIRVVKEVLPKDAHYHLAVSMGPDSVAALFWMRWKGYSFTPVHFDHNLRAQNSVMRERFFALCDKIGLEGKSEVWCHGGGTEAQCREARLDFFSRTAKKGTVVTAHHLDDWIESYLLNCLRGQPNHQPFNLESEFPEFKVVHPFLPTRKSDFADFIERNGWAEWIVQDETNSSTSGSRRNWIRQAIIPEMERQKISLEKYARRRIKRLAGETEAK
jgi:tRNA(Ile)-lysidine synthetase-like protein